MITRSIKPYVWYILLGVCYPLGEYLQNNVPATPQFLRFHLSDFGFAPYHSFKAFILWSIFDKFDESKLGGWLKAGLGATVILALIWELMGPTDWIDVACYIAGAWLAAKLLPKKSLPAQPKNSGTPTRFKGHPPQVTRKTKRKPRRH